MSGTTGTEMFEVLQQRHRYRQGGKQRRKEPSQQGTRSAGGEEGREAACLLFAVTGYNSLVGTLCSQVDAQRFLCRFQG